MRTHGMGIGICQNRYDRNKYHTMMCGAPDLVFVFVSGQVLLNQALVVRFVATYFICRCAEHYVFIT